MKKQGKERIIFDNYEPWNYEEEARENLLMNGIENPSIDQIYDEVYEYLSTRWEDEESNLKNFFEGSTWILFGTCGLWHGTYAAGTIFADFTEMFDRAITVYT